MSRSGLAALAVLLCAATVAAVAASDGSVSLAVAPAVVIAAMYAAWRVPLRWPLLLITFLGLALENPTDVPAQGLWKSPLYPLGAVLLAHLNVTLPHRALLFSGMDVILVYLAIVAVTRSISGSRVDAGVPGAPPMRTFLWLALAGAGWMWLYGVLPGGADVASSLWQVQRVVYLPIIALLFLRALRGPKDYAALGKVLIGAACVKACVAVYVAATVAPPKGDRTLQYATTHPDSMLFAGAVCLVIILLIQRQDKGRVLLAAGTLPLLVAGMIANNRRIVWVEIIAGLLVVFALARRTPFKRVVMQAAVLSTPVTIPYVLIGWGSQRPFFHPVRLLRSVVDSRSDMSAAWRDLENYDLLYTLRHHPLLGTGYGHGYDEVIKLPDISTYYSLYRFIPHNAILGLWTYGGIVGFTALWLMFVVGIFFAARAHRFARDMNARAAALGSIVALVVYFVHCYGDMGFGTWTGVFTVAPALAVAAKVAVGTGAWGRQPVAPTPISVAATAKEVAA